MKSNTKPDRRARAVEWSSLPIWPAVDLPTYASHALIGGARRCASAPLRRAVLHRDGHLCRYCGLDATVVDHLLARRDGGEDRAENLGAACVYCNNLKGGQSQEWLRFALWFAQSGYRAIVSGPQYVAMARAGLVMELPRRVPFFFEFGNGAEVLQ